MLLPRLTSLVQATILAVDALGGQHTARRNAWAAMSADAARARARREAAAAMTVAVAVAEQRSGAAAAQAR